MRIVKIILKAVKWMFIGILLLIALILVAIQIPIVKKQIVRIAEKQINNLLTVELSIGKLNGNFFTGLEMHDVLLTSEKQDTIAFISALDLKYKLLPLIQGEIHVDRVFIEKPYVFLKQLSDSTWNFQHITKPSSDNDEDTTSSTFNMVVNVCNLEINNGNISIESFTSQIPKKIQNLYINLSGSYSQKVQSAEIKDFHFLAFAPDLELKKLNVNASGNKQSISLTNLLLQTSQNELSISGEYRFNQKEKSFITLETNPIILSEFKYFLPEDFQPQAKPIINLNAELKDKQLMLDLQLKDKQQRIDLQLLSSHLIEYFLDSTADLTYDIALDTDKIKIGYWLNNPKLTHIIDGQLLAKGEGLDPKTMTSHVKGNFNDITFQGNSIEKLNILLNYKSGNVKGEIDGKGSFGDIYVESEVRQLLEQRPIYHVNISTNNLDIASVVGEKYASDINLKASINGTGFDINKIDAQGDIEISPSQIMGISIDTLGTNVDFTNQNLIINSLIAKALDAQLYLNGNYSLHDTSDIFLYLELDSVKKVSELINIKDLETNAELNAHLTGKPDNLKTTLNLNIGKTRYQEYFLDSLFAEINGQLIGKEILADGSIQVDKISIDKMIIDTVQLQVATNTKDFDIHLHVGSQDINTNISSLVQLGETIQIALSELWLDYKGYQLKMQDDTSHINIGENYYEIKDLTLISNATDTLQTISANGIISRNAEQDFMLNVQNLDIAEIIRIFASEQEINGKLNLHAQLSGNATYPTLDGELHTDNLSLNNFLLDTLSAKILYDKNILSAEVQIIPKDSGFLVINGKLPMTARLDSMMFDIKPKKSDSIFLQASIDKLPLSIANIIYPLDNVIGYIQSNISFGGTFGKPDISGNLNIADGQVELKIYGIDYRDINVGINIGNESINIDTFLIVSHKGNMQVKGNIEFESELYNGKFNTSELQINFNRFHPLNHKYYNMEMSGEIDLNATTDSLNFLGEIDIAEAMVYLPAVMNLLGQNVSEIPKPLLVIQMEKDSIIRDSIIYNIHHDTTTTAESQNNQDSQLTFFNNIQGSMKIKVPRNTWIKNDDMRIELSGDIELIKHKDFFEVFGTIDIVRGQYNLLGKVFIIESGSITFQGGEKLNPLLNIEAIYSFRDNDRNKQDLTLIVSGDLSAPEIKFTYEDSQISKGDALSYILFGTNMDALTSGQQQSMSSGLDVSGLAEMVASSFISSQLTKFLGNTFNVDYIEFKSDSSFDNASLTVGKYITNKLFVSYLQTIGHIEDTDVARYEMTMEYELFKFLFLQLTSSSITNGFDVIFKFNSNIVNH